MSFSWQDAATLATVLVAVGYVALRLARRIRHIDQGGCGCCEKCPTNNADPSLVTIVRESDET